MTSRPLSGFYHAGGGLHVQAACLHFPIENIFFQRVIGRIDIPVGKLPQILTQKIIPEKIHQGFAGYGRIDKRRAQLEAFHMGNQVAFRHPCRFSGGLVLYFMKRHGPPGIEYELEQFVAVVAEPPPVRFTVMDNMARHAIDSQVMAQILRGF